VVHLYSLTVHIPAAQIPVEESGFVHGVPSCATDSLMANNVGFVLAAAHTSWHGVTPVTVEIHKGLFKLHC